MSGMPLELMLNQVKTLELMLNNSEELTPEEKESLKTKLENLIENL